MGIFHDFFARNYLSISKITWKMAFSLKLPIKDFFTTQCIILLLFLLFSQIKIGGALIISQFFFIETSGICKTNAVSNTETFVSLKQCYYPPPPIQLGLMCWEQNWWRKSANDISIIRTTIFMTPFRKLFYEPCRTSLTYRRNPYYNWMFYYNWIG